MEIPPRGLGNDVLGALRAARKDDFPWRNGKLYAYTFDGGPTVEAVGKQAYAEYLSENGLDPTTFPSLLRFENDVVDLARRHLRGDDDVVGSFTSGGTESIMLAVKVARDWFRAKRPGVRPQMIVPITAHAAFHKAAHYLDVELVASPVDPRSFRADPEAMSALVSDRTMMLVASASSYAHGVVDPVRVIAAIAERHGILCHVDGCIGGFLLPYFRRLGAKVPDFDFAVPGVTSISMDLHKYALTPKGASVVLYRDESLRRHQLFACSEWTGYTLVNNTIQSSKSGGPLAAAWSVLQAVGDDGYLEFARGMLQARDRIVVGLQRIDGLRVMGEPEMSLVAFTSDDVSVFAVVDEMKARGFGVQAQLAFGPSKENIHLSINPSNVAWTTDLLAALRASVEAVRAAGGGPKPPKELAAMLAQQMENDPTGQGLANLMSSLGADGAGNLPERMAEIHALMNELPPPLREKLVVSFVGRMFTPPRPTGRSAETSDAPRSSPALPVSDEARPFG